ncbi:MAG: glucuronate isomerase [Sedimentisphaerales bacterium]|nr:glucuronate isomerase [Sedimentisphaerales bacterium]
MAVEFLSDDFLLQSDTARTLYHKHAAEMPIYDYHCHLPADQIAADVQFENMTQIWLYGDHYKWRAMRSNGIEERYCTGDASDWDKFAKWAETVPYCLRNPLYHWTHLELKRPFGITGTLLGPDTAREIYEACNEMLAMPEFSVRNIMRKMNVKLVCTTEDPLDSLEHHQKIRADGFEIKVHTAWRPDKAMAAENVANLNAWIDRLAELTDMEICTFADYLEAISKRHQYFHDNGCRLSDHGLETAVAEDYTKNQIETIFGKIRTVKPLTPDEVLQFKSVMMIEFALLDWQKGWVQQLHLGPMRNNNSRMFAQLGPDTGFDSIGDYMTAAPLARFLDRLDRTNRLPKTILYNIHPRDNEVMATMLGNFQDGSCPGKMQYGSGWWFLDQMDGMIKQMNALSNLGLLSRFVGMLTDSRSFLSYPRHEYFRRILCNLLGDDVEKGLLPKDMSLLGQMVEDICYNNARNYFPMECE